MKNKIFNFFEKLIWNEKSLLIIICLISLSLILNNDDKPESQKIKENLTRLDTLIPLGYVLTPIEVRNKDILKNLIQDYGLVDLYYHNPLRPHSKPIPIVRAIKIIRAPNDPNQYAVLLTENQVNDLLKYDGPYSVAIKNPNDKIQQKFIKKKISRKIIINQENEND